MNKRYILLLFSLAVVFHSESLHAQSLTKRTRYHIDLFMDNGISYVNTTSSYQKHSFGYNLALGLGLHYYYFDDDFTVRYALFYKEQSYKVTGFKDARKSIVGSKYNEYLTYDKTVAHSSFGIDLQCNFVFYRSPHRFNAHRFQFFVSFGTEISYHLFKQTTLPLSDGTKEFSWSVDNKFSDHLFIGGLSPILKGGIGVNIHLTDAWRLFVAPSYSYDLYNLWYQNVVPQYHAIYLQTAIQYNL